MARDLMKSIDCQDEATVPSVSASENLRILNRLVADWHLGPDKASPRPGDNKDYWIVMAQVWMIPEADARRQLCANCEYFNNRPEALKVMESIPFNRFDADGGGRGFCHKFDFVCHNLRVCQAWEKKDFELPDGGDE